MQLTLYMYMVYVMLPLLGWGLLLETLRYMDLYYWTGSLISWVVSHLILRINKVQTSIAVIMVCVYKRVLLYMYINLVQCRCHNYVSRSWCLSQCHTWHSCDDEGISSVGDKWDRQVPKEQLHCPSDGVDISIAREVNAITCSKNTCTCI